MSKKLVVCGALALVIGLVLFFVSGTVEPETGKPLYPELYGPQQILFIALIVIGLIMVVIGFVRRSVKEK